MDKDFDISRVAFSKDDFLTLVDSNLPRGSFILADETGSWFGARDWNTQTNKLLTELLEIFRIKRLGVIFTVPLNAQADITLRRMADVVIETIAINRKRKEVECKYKYVEVNPISGDIYRKFLYFPDKDGNMLTVSKLHFDKPPYKLTRLYDKKKLEWTNERISLNKNYKPMMTKCDKCGYEWKYKGSAKSPTCPSCHIVVNKKNLV